MKNASLVIKNSQISPGEVYEVSMWVKMDSYEHTKGAIKIGSTSSSQFPWALTDSMKAVVPIADLTDGKWHKVTFNLMTSGYYLALQTPGYCSIYIDDVTIKHLPNGSPSNEVEYTEYVPVMKDASGKIPDVGNPDAETITDERLDVYTRLKKLLEEYGDFLDLDDEYDEDYEDIVDDEEPTDDDGIIDDSDDTDDGDSAKKIKKKKTEYVRVRNALTFKDILTGNSYAWYTIAFYSGVVIIVGGAVTAIVLLKRRKRQKKTAEGEVTK